jgi:purine-nucleoside phosphorylase
MKFAGHGTSPINRLRDWHAEFAIVLGSGLGAIAPAGEEMPELSYAEFAELPKASVPGHVGRFILGQINQMRIIFAQGRVHFYEGFSARDVTAGVRLLADTGVKNLILTNAAGSANPDFAPGSWMMIKDHINLTGTSPLVGTRRPPVGRTPPSASHGVRSGQLAKPISQDPPKFIDLTSAYSPELRERFANAAKKIGMPLHEGVYAGLIGPQYETPAEVRMLQKLGADAVGMSTVLEVIQARALGLEVAAFSCLTNFAAGISAVKLRHEDVLEMGNIAATDFWKLLNTGLR